MPDRGVGEALLDEADAVAVSGVEIDHDHRSEEAREVFHGGRRDPRSEGIVEARRCGDAVAGDERGAGFEDDDVVRTGAGVAGVGIRDGRSDAACDRSR